MPGVTSLRRRAVPVGAFVGSAVGLAVGAAVVGMVGAVVGALDGARWQVKKQMLEPSV